MGLQTRIVELLPEIDDIDDNTLRERVIATWMAAVKRGEWSEEELEGIPFSLVIDASVLNLFTFTRAVTRTCLAIAGVFDEIYGESVRINLNTLLVAGLLHDVGKLLEYGRNSTGNIVKSHSGRLLRHPVSGAILAAELGISDEIIHIIAGHGDEGSQTPRTIEGVILHHAAFLNLQSFEAQMKMGHQ